MVRLSYQTMLKTSCIVKITRCTTGAKKNYFFASNKKIGTSHKRVGQKN